jgi:hypothetical protein
MHVMTHVMTHVMNDEPAVDAPGLPTALAAVAEAWVRLPRGAVQALVATTIGSL